MGREQLVGVGGTPTQNKVLKVSKVSVSGEERRQACTSCSGSERG
ncbi:unnamed protein product [Chondrus crispus]|uniref:Uncharacterized protein n=1 Tax=Chondrus crispus TaxID=2769 RepID=R7QIE8_CHOCR|nr:unnamed protein product [Chondrus crispus]CDF37849.1 unnamed protein product [Chondrus crispus]|eukprot:XP_005717720.1 unnamed protein product [Chondrus crispus]